MKREQRSREELCRSRVPSEAESECSSELYDSTMKSSMFCGGRSEELVMHLRCSDLADCGGSGRIGLLTVRLGYMVSERCDDGKKKQRGCPKLHTPFFSPQAEPKIHSGATSATLTRSKISPECWSCVCLNGMQGFDTARAQEVSEASLFSPSGLPCT